MKNKRIVDCLVGYGCGVFSRRKDMAFLQKEQKKYFAKFRKLYAKFREVDYQRFTILNNNGLNRMDECVPVGGASFLLEGFLVQSAADGRDSAGRFADQNGHVARREAQLQQHTYFPLGLG